MDSSESRETFQISSSENDDPDNSLDVLVPQILRRVFIGDKAATMVEFVLLKYQKKELVTEAEMLHLMDHSDHEHFPLIFKEVCECMCLGFGINVSKSNSLGHTYDLVPLLGLTCKGTEGGEQIFPKIDLLLVILMVIFVRGNCASEEDIREVVRKRQMLPNRNFPPGDRWKFITEDLVQAGYLEYQQLPGSHCAHHQFLWGPRAYAEITKMRILEHLSKMNKINPSSYPHLCDQALSEEIEAARKQVQTMEGAMQYQGQGVLHSSITSLVLTH
ncbi:melanoma-associated antigen 10-like [Octodon degus]|uniref:Melanoma-associated antigen 10-like n=1 Tax=Octodon degus TaxID=10160 RepID=A0A6P3VDG6_OCTDE|nr:melanoma-associated antigen 10-like [Octodon degus]